MDRRRMGTADGGRVVHLNRRTRRLEVVVAVQNVLVTACLVVTLYVCWGAQTPTPSAKQASKDDVHIRFNPTSGFSGNKTLEFGVVYSNSTMSLTDKDEIDINCTGPYILYMHVCYKDLNKENATGILQLEVAGRESPASTFTLHAPHEVCRGLHSIAYLKAKERARLRLYSTGGFKIMNVNVGLNYLLGSRCEY